MQARDDNLFEVSMVVDDDDGDNGALIYRATSGDLKKIFWISVSFIYFALSYPILFYPQA
jgi:hypothetical protein